MSARTLLLALAAAILWGGCARNAAAPADGVPASHAALYRGLERILDAELAAQARRGGEAQKPLLSAELLAANANRGPALLAPQTLDVVRLSLDRLRELGASSVKLGLHYPLLRPGFPRRAEYLAFYRQVVAEARQRGLKVMAQMTVMFSDTPFSPFTGLHRGLDLERFAREYREMAHLVVRELAPDYLNLLSEPDTHARLSGLRELEEPRVYAGVVREALRGLQRGRTRVGAGTGSWSSPAFARELAATDIDYLCIHVYPITGRFLENAREMARIARAAGKQAVIDEAWLYKVLRPGGGDDIAATAEVFKRDLFSFWEPLDRKFVRAMLGLAAEERVELVSFFWSGLFFAYLEHTPRLERLSYAELTRRHNAAAYAAMQAGRFSGLGEFVRAGPR